VESSRNCNIRRNFCSLTGEKGGCRKYDLNDIKRRTLAVGNKQIVFIDNIVYGNDRAFFGACLGMLKDLFRQGRIDGWSPRSPANLAAWPKTLARPPASSPGRIAPGGSRAAPIRANPAGLTCAAEGCIK
jgi:hypothetical protein